MTSWPTSEELHPGPCPNAHPSLKENCTYEKEIAVVYCNAKHIQYITITIIIITNATYTIINHYLTLGIEFSDGHGKLQTKEGRTQRSL